MSEEENQEENEQKIEDTNQKPEEFSDEDALETKETEPEMIHAQNLIEEASEIVENCVKCGLCKSLCPVFKVLREEHISPRGHSILLNEKIIEECIFKCNLCRACEVKCPLDLKICDAILKAREALTLQNKNLKTNEEMIKNIRETGNPFGADADKNEGKLYCC